MTRGFHLIRACDLETTRTEYIDPDKKIEKDTLVSPFGDSGACKTAWLVHELCSIAAGGALAVCLVGEGQRGFKRRLLAWCIEHGKDLADLPVYLKMAPTAMKLRGVDRVRGTFLDTEYRFDKDDAGIVRMSCTKSKDSVPPEPCAFELKQVPLPGIVDDEGRDVFGVVLVPTEYEPARVPGKAGRGKWQQVALKAYQDLQERYQANLEPGLTTEKSRAPACRLLGKIKRKINWPQFLEEADLGDLRLIRELERKLTAMRTEFYQGKAVAECEDNGTQTRALELLADLLGKRKSEVAVSGKLEVETAADMSPEERRAYLKANAPALRKMLDELAPPDEKPAAEGATLT